MTISWNGLKGDLIAIELGIKRGEIPGPAAFRDAIRRIRRMQATALMARPHDEAPLVTPGGTVYAVWPDEPEVLWLPSYGGVNGHDLAEVTHEDTVLLFIREPLARTSERWSPDDEAGLLAATIDVAVVLGGRGHTLTIDPLRPSERVLEL